MSKLLYGGQYTVGLDQLGFVTCTCKYEISKYVNHNSFVKAKSAKRNWNILLMMCSVELPFFIIFFYLTVYQTFSWSFDNGIFLRKMVAVLRFGPTSLTPYHLGFICR
jgi:hypothetical protein